MNAAGLRKAAIVIASLEPQAAQQMLDQLPAEQAEQVRQLAARIDDVDPDEQAQVVEEFCRLRPLVPDRDQQGIEIDDALADRLAPPAAEVPDAAAADRPFQFLQQTEAGRLAGILAGERPQTIALVLSHLPSDRGAGVLGQLPAAVQAEVIQRMVELEPTDPEIVREVEEALQARLFRQLDMQRRRSSGLDAVAVMLRATDAPAALQILDSLAARDRHLAERLSPGCLEFDALATADGAMLDAVLEAADPQLWSVALIGAPADLVERWLARMPAANARVLRQQLREPGPTPLAEVEAARRQIVQLAQSYLAGEPAYSIY